MYCIVISHNSGSLIINAVWRTVQAMEAHKYKYNYFQISYATFHAFRPLAWIPGWSSGCRTRLVVRSLWGLKKRFRCLTLHCGEKWLTANPDHESTNHCNRSWICRVHQPLKKPKPKWAAAVGIYWF